ncbi:MAG: class I SAM-dependent methyltransferase [Acidobacteriota bacterium]
MDAVLYPGVSENWDDEAFRGVVLWRLHRNDSLLDLGAGAGDLAQTNFRGSVGRTVGVDLDPRVLDNPHLDEAKVGSATSIPYPDGEFDVVIADNVLEHLDEPARAFAEVSRVLRPGGWFLCKTPNAWHYVALASRCTPHGFHQRYNARRGRDRRQTFPTHYRANSARRIRKLAAGAGMAVRAITHLEGRPEYLRVHPVTYAFGCAYERIVARFRSLRWLRVTLIGELQKPSAPGSSGSLPSGTRR